MGNFGLQLAGLPGYGSLGVERVYFVKTVTWKIFLIFCFLALNLKMNGLRFGIFSRKVSNSNYLEKNILLYFIENLDKSTTNRLLLGGLSLPFDSRIADFLNKFVAVSIRKIYRIRQHDQRSAFILMKGHCCNCNIFILFSVLFYPFF